MMRIQSDQIGRNFKVFGLLFLPIWQNFEPTLRGLSLGYWAIFQRIDDGTKKISLDESQL